MNRVGWVGAVLLWGCALAHGAEAPAKGSDKVPLGSPDFYPSPEHPVGWRGDGSGHYPGATPPAEWSRGEKGERKNILWETKLPCYTWATPIVLGDKVITRSEPYDLICLNKLTGKVLWIRSHPPVSAATADEKHANPALAEIDPLLVELQKLNDAFVANGWSQALCKQKHDLQKKIDELSAAADKKYQLPPDMYVESWSGYTGATPCSDGQHVFIASGSGITACYDLDGKLAWQRYENVKPVWGEHGSACSPLLCGDLFLVHTQALHAFEKATGKERYTFEGRAPWTPYAIISAEVGGVKYAVVGGAFYRVEDGKIAWPRPGDLAGNQMVTNGGETAYFSGGYAGFYAMQAAPEKGLKMTPLVKEEYDRIKFPKGDNPAYKINNSISDFYTASPLYHDGLLYVLGNWGRLVVLDTAKTKQDDALVYTCFPPFDLKNPFSRKSVGMGICANPALAGKYIYLLDSAGCVLVMEPGRAFKLVAKNNIDETVPEGVEQKYWLGPHHEQTEASLTFDGNRIYMRGEQYLYCIGEK